MTVTAIAGIVMIALIFVTLAFGFPIGLRIGLGSAAAAAGLQGDVPLLLGITLFSALFVSVGNLLADLLYGAVDPRVREVGA